jgi:D-alanyl-lipoteichoic acid acyltransferase DltB (MBOAT superfamily)
LSFISFQFLSFFAIVSAVYFLLPLRGRWAWLLAASTLFYMAFIPAYVLIIYGTIVVDYVAGLLIEKTRGGTRLGWLLVSLAANIGVLAVFKYWNFLVGNIGALASVVGARSPLAGMNIVLPIGLSFHTFQAMSYTIEVYRGRWPAERNFVVYALYVFFYPQLVAGPIERPQHVLPQLRQYHRFVADDAVRGLRRILWGFFKKAVVADHLAILVNAVYEQPSHFPGPILVLATVAFSFQIYADFSGYSDIALGTAEFMGIRLMTNFRQPYFSQSIGEFWSRWHISLSTWFRDYVYIPLGGNRVGAIRHAFNLLITFLISGLWHGANWTYVVWGGLNGCYLIVEKTLGQVTAGGRTRRAGSIIVTFALITVAWVFFRANTLRDAAYIIGHLGSDVSLWLSPQSLRHGLAAIGITSLTLAIVMGATLVLITADWWADSRGEDLVVLAERLPIPGRWTLYYALGFATALMGVFGQQQFIYFQF